MEILSSVSISRFPELWNLHFNHFDWIHRSRFESIHQLQRPGAAEGDEAHITHQAHRSSSGIPEPIVREDSIGAMARLVVSFFIPSNLYLLI